MPAKKKAATKSKKAPAKTKKKKAAKKKEGPASGSMKAIISELNSQLKFEMFKTDSDELLSEVTDWIPTGCELLDIVTGGGFPVGRITEIFGKKGSGKSTLAQQALAECQKMGGLGVYIDTENAFDRERAAYLGVNARDLVYLEPPFLEDCFEAMVKLVQKVRSTDALKGRPILVVWDTMIYTKSRMEIDEKTKEVRFDGMVGAQRAKILHQMMGHLLDIVAREHIAFVFVNHVTDKIGAFFPGQYSKAGGSAPDYATSLQIYLREDRSKVAAIMDGDEQVGSGVKFKIEKSRHGSKREVRARLNWFTGIDNAGSMVDFLKDRGIARKDGAKYLIQTPEEEFAITTGPAGEQTFIDHWNESESFREACLDLARKDIYSVIPWKRQKEDEPDSSPLYVDPDEATAAAIEDLYAKKENKV